MVRELHTELNFPIKVIIDAICSGVAIKTWLMDTSSEKGIAGFRTVLIMTYVHYPWAYAHE